MPKPGGGSKYRAKKADCAQGHTHDSGREAKRCDTLHVLEKDGAICDLEVQPQFWFEIDGQPIKHMNGRRCGYKADFLYTDLTTQARVVEDSKGFVTSDWRLRRTIFRALFPHLELREV